MYLRHAVRRKGGKAHTYWRLVRSVRRGDRVVQETVAHLGELDAQGRAKARALAQQITGRGAQRELCEAEVARGAAIAVRLNEIRLERPRAFGAVWLGWTLWRARGLDTLCAELLPPGREAVPWATMAAVLVLARLCEPSSELHIAEDWYRGTALEDLLEVPSAQVNDALPRPRPAAAAQARDRDASEGAAGRALRARLRSAALRCDQHVLRGAGGGESARAAGLQSRSSPRLQAGEHHAGGDPRGSPAGL